MKHFYKQLSTVLIITLILPSIYHTIPVYARGSHNIATASDAENGGKKIEEELVEDILTDEVVIGDLYMVEEKPSFLTKEQAFSYILDVVGKNSDEIEFRERLYNTQGISLYEALVFSTGGYMIYMPDYAMVVEYSDSEDKWYPYQDVMEHKKYYIGPMIYLYEEDGHIRSVHDDTKVYLEHYEETERLILDYAQQMGKRVCNDTETPSDATASYSDATASNPRARVLATTNWIDENVIADEWGFRRMPFGYNIGFGQYPGGSCGILASSMLLSYHHTFHKPLLTANLIPSFDAKPPSDEPGRMGSDQNAIYHHLLLNYAHESVIGVGGTLIGYDIDMLNNYIGNELKDSNIHAVRTTTNMDIVEAIDNNRPVALYGIMSDDPVSSSIIPIAHAVLTYGYKIEYDGYGQDPMIKMYKMHYGWHGSNYVDNDGSSNQIVRELWVSPFALSGGIIIEETIDHIHEAYDTNGDKDKYGTYLFSCAEKSCNALISDDYPNYRDNAEYIWLDNSQITQPGAINYEEDIDYFRVYVTADGMLSVRADFDNPVTGELRIYDKDGNELRAVTVPQSGSDGKGYAIDRYTVEQGTYYVSIYSEQADQYQLNFSLISDFTDSDHVVLLDEHAYNDIADDYYQLEVPHKGRVRIKAELGSVLIGNVVLYDQDGNLIKNGSSYSTEDGFGYHINEYLLESGSYKVRVYFKTATAYHLKATITSKDDYGDTLADADVIQFNKDNKIVLNAKANYAKDYDFFKIEVPHKGSMDVRLDFENQFTGNLYIMDAAGSTKRTGSHLAGTDLKVYHISQCVLEAGTYYIRVYAPEENRYQMSVTLTEKDDHGDTMGTASLITLEDNKVILSAKANYAKDYDFFKIDVPHKGSMDVRLDFENQFTGNLYIMDAAGSTKRTGSHLAGTDLKVYHISQCVLEAGTYYIRVYAPQENRYQMSVTLTEKDDHGDTMGTATPITLKDNQVTINAKANYADDYDFFQLVLPNKGYITVRLDFEHAFIGNLYVMDAAGNTKASGQTVTGTDQKGYHVNKRLLEAGTYYIRVYSTKEDKYQMNLSFTTE